MGGLKLEERRAAARVRWIVAAPALLTMAAALWMLVVAPAAAQSQPATPPSVFPTQADRTLTAAWPADATVRHVADGSNFGQAEATPTPPPESLTLWLIPPSPKLGPAPTSTPDPTPAPSPDPTPAPSPDPTPAPSPDPTPAPTPNPTPAPTPDPTPQPTPAPTPNPTPEPTPQPTPPAIPTGLTAAAGNASVTLAWDVPFDASITGYEYRQRAAPPAPGWGPWTAIADSDATTVAFTITGLTNGVEYRFRLRAVGAAGPGPPAPADDPRYVVATPQIPPPDMVAGVTAAWANGALTAAWPAVAGASGYDAALSADHGQTWTVVADNRSEPGLTLVNNVSAADTYVVRVRARNAGGAGAWRNSAPLTPPQPLIAPAAVALAMQTSETAAGGERRIDGIHVTWDAVTGAAIYNLRCRIVQNHNVPNDTTRTDRGWPCAGRVTGTSAAITSTAEHPLRSNAGYEVAVQAVDANHITGAWSDWTVSYPVFRSPARVVKRGNGSLTIEWTPQFNNDGGPAGAQWGVKYRAWCSADGTNWTRCADNVDHATSRVDGNPQKTVSRGIVNGAAYYVRGQAYNATGQGGVAQNGPYPALTPPARFASVTAARGDGTIVITLHRPAQSWFTSYDIQCRLDGGTAWAACAGSPFTANLDHADLDRETFTINAIPNASGYQVRARGVNGLGTGAWSDPVAVPAISAPGRIGAIWSWRPPGSGALTVSWDEPGGGWLTYDLQCSSDNGATWTAPCTRGAGSVTDTLYSETLSGVSDGAHYKVRARAGNALGTGAWRESATIAAVARLTAANVTETAATLTIADYTGSWYYQRQTPETYAACQGPVQGNSVTLTGLSPSTAYAYWAYTDAACGEASRLDTGNHPTAFTTRPPPPPANLGAEYGGPGSLIVMWRRLAGLGYQVQCSADTGPPYAWTDCLTVAAQDTPYHADLSRSISAPNVTRVRVRATVDNRTSDWVESTLTPPSPANLGAQYRDGSLTVWWDRPSDVSGALVLGYQVQCSADTGPLYAYAPCHTQAPSADASFTASIDTPNVTQVRVRSTADGRNSRWWNVGVPSGPVPGASTNLTFQTGDRYVVGWTKPGDAPGAVGYQMQCLVLDLTVGYHWSDCGTIAPTADAVITHQFRLYYTIGLRLYDAVASNFRVRAVHNGIVGPWTTYAQETPE